MSLESSLHAESIIGIYPLSTAKARWEATVADAVLAFQRLAKTVLNPPEGREAVLIDLIGPSQQCLSLLCPLVEDGESKPKRPKPVVKRLLAELDPTNQLAEDLVFCVGVGLHDNLTDPRQVARVNYLAQLFKLDIRTAQDKIRCWQRNTETALEVARGKHQLGVDIRSSYAYGAKGDEDEDD